MAAADVVVGDSSSRDAVISRLHVFEESSVAYQYILFDLDDTLFDFPADQALALALQHYSVTLTAELLADYQALNHALWQQYNVGEIDAQTLKAARFSVLAPLAGTDPLTLNARFLQEILACSQPLRGVEQTLSRLHGRVGLGIITNGFADVQRARLNRSRLDRYFDFMLISEEEGVTKPDPRIFLSALTRMPDVSAEDVLMVGDNPGTDVAGATAAGMDSCWFNLRHQRIAVQATHVIEEFEQLLGLPRIQPLLAS